MKFSPAFRPTHIQDVLCQMHSGQWFGFDGELIYENLVIHDKSIEKPEKGYLEFELEKMQGEYDWHKIRVKRDDLLKETDHWAFVDAVKIMSDAMKDYRKLLRDIPQDYDKPEEVIFPIKPDEK